MSPQHAYRLIIVDVANLEQHGCSARCRRFTVVH